MQVRRTIYLVAVGTCDEHILEPSSLYLYVPQDSTIMRVLVSFLTLLGAVQAFVNPTSRPPVGSNALSMAPKFDKTTQRWYPTSPDEGPEAGYPLVNTLLLHGPKPFLQRAFRKEEYEQAVLKFMAGDKVSRQEAMGNMDAYLNNPNDWAVNRLAYQNGGYKPDYVTLRQDALILTLTWSAIVFTITGRVAWSLYTGNDFWGFIY